MAPIYSIETSVEIAEALRKLGFNLKENLQIADLDRNNWIVVPHEFTGGKYSLEMNPARISSCSAVERVGKDLEINYKNTSKDSLGREFVGTNNWKESLMLNQFLGVKTPNMKEEIDYLDVLYLGSQGVVKVYDVSGKQVDSKLCEKYLMDTIGGKSLWRAEWIDNDFKKKGKNLEVRFNHIFDKEGNAVNYESEVLDGNTLMKDEQVDVIDFITENHTSQGHVHKKVNAGNFYSYFPRDDDNSVAAFGANSVRAVLDCNRGPSVRNSSLGVRAAKLRE